MVINLNTLLSKSPLAVYDTINELKDVHHTSVSVITQVSEEFQLTGVSLHVCHRRATGFHW